MTKESGQAGITVTAEMLEVGQHELSRLFDPPTHVYEVNGEHLATVCAAQKAANSA